MYLQIFKRNYLVGTYGGGLTSYDGFRFIHYSPKEGLFSKTITSIINDKKGDLWLGTADAGVCRFNGNSFTYYTQKEGLSNNLVWSLFADPAGHIWAGTENGLNRLIPAENGIKIIKYGRQDGLKASDFNLHSVIMTGNNSIWWGTGKNVVMKDLDSLSLFQKINTPRLSQIEINEKLYDFRHFPDSLRHKIKYSSVAPFTGQPDQLSLSHDQNHLRFYFSAIDWAAPDKILYSFRLMGIDKEWSKPSLTPYAEYRNLSHGNYEFHLKAAGRTQTWSDSFIYRFTIRPAWWQRIWFRSFVILLLLTGLFLLARLIYLYQLRKQRGLMEQQLAVQMERQRISAEMHDDIGAGLSGIRLMTEMTRNKLKDDQSMKDVEKIYQSVGDISSKMKEVIWSLNTENDHLSNLLSYLQQQIRIWLEHYPCQLKISLPAEIPDQPVSGEDRRNIFLIVKEAVHNMIKHSGADQLEVVMEYNAGQLRIKIADNGRGIAEQHTGKTGNGMRNMQQRAEMLRGKMEAESKNGLTLTFTIPLFKSYDHHFHR